MKDARVTELVLQSLEHEMGGVVVYETALSCAINTDLMREWQGYLQQTHTHVEVLQDLCTALSIDAEQEIPGREVVRHTGKALVGAMNLALEGDTPEAAQLVACECVVLAETKDHANWELLGQCAQAASGSMREALTAACDQVEDEEDEHLYHTKGWCRELWLNSLGLASVLPPPEEVRKVRTAIGAAKAQAESMAKRASAGAALDSVRNG